MRRRHLNFQFSIFNFQFQNRHPLTTANKKTLGNFREFFCWLSAVGGHWVYYHQGVVIASAVASRSLGRFTKKSNPVHSSIWSTLLTNFSVSL